tara:strand:- start:435 stop:599 length:165 start_codon:yes stop_codon:yes gene_type:complete
MPKTVTINKEYLEELKKKFEGMLDDNENGESWEHDEDIGGLLEDIIDDIDTMLR